MQTVFLSTTRAPRSAAAVFGSALLLFSGAMPSFSQAPMAPMGQPAATDAAGQNKELADQVTALRAQVARLEAAVQQTGSGKKPKAGMRMSSAANPSMGMMGDRSEMGMASKGAMASGKAPMRMKDDEGEMGDMPPGGKAPMSPGMSMGDDNDEMSGMPMGGKSKSSSAPAAAMGMCCMGSGGNAAQSGTPPGAGGMASMNGSSAMPGQAGASHLYHIGSNGFFLNHSRHITLTQDQRLTLNHLKEKAMLESAYEQRRIDQGEQELYTLTGGDQPDNSKIQGKVVEIEKLRASQRMNFIRAVEEASNVLTPEQRKALLGTMAANK